MLETSRQAADYYIRQTPLHGVPPNDWREQHPALRFEASAAAIAAAGMLRLAACLFDLSQPAAALEYRNYALRILSTLRSAAFTAASTPGWEGILLHATYHEAKGLGVDESVMWGDYFYLEALDLASPARRNLEFSEIESKPRIETDL